jgi:hypothetical protein
MRMRIFCAVAMTLAASSAYAANNTLVDLPWGTFCNDILAALQPAAVSLAGLALTWLTAKLGPDIARALHAAHIDQVMTRAIDAGFAFVEGAEKGKVLEISVANEVLRSAAKYLVAQAPGLFKELGDNLGQMLVARLSASGALPPQASAANLDLAPAAHMKTERAAA